MIPNPGQVSGLWDKYHLPPQKRIHAALVAKVAVFLAGRSERKNQINMPLLEAAALLHDIDKSIPKLPGEEHPDAAVRVLREEGMEEVAGIVKTHPLHAILNPLIAPATREEKLLFLADKMVKYEILTVDRRFALWREEDLSKEVRAMLDLSYPEVKRLETEVFTGTGILPETVAKLA
jgi:HD superfamily phosphodiesterase